MEMYCDGRWFTIKEASLIMKVNESSVCTNCKKLEKNGFLERKIVKRPGTCQMHLFRVVKKKP